MEGESETSLDNNIQQVETTSDSNPTVELKQQQQEEEEEQKIVTIPIVVAQELAQTFQPEPSLIKQAPEEIHRRDTLDPRTRTQNESITQSSNSPNKNHTDSYLLDQKELNELISIDVQSIALQRSISPMPGQGQQVGTPRPGQIAKRKNSDDDYFVEETLLFTFRPHLEGDGSTNHETLESEGNDSSSPSKGRSPISQTTFESMLQSVDDLRDNLLIEVHHCCKIRGEDEDDQNEESDSDDDGMDSDNEEIIERDKQILKMMMNNEYPDAEIDKLLEAFRIEGGAFKNDILNGEFIENDIRLSEAIREAIEEIKFVQRPNTSKSAELEKKKFLAKYFSVAEMLGVSLTVEHLLPALLELFKQDHPEIGGKGFVKPIFDQIDKLLDLLAASSITVGYNGVRDYIMQLLSDFFTPDMVEETLKQELQPQVLNSLVKASKILTQEDRTDKVLPIILENIKDDSDEERRILGLEMVDMLCEDLGKDVCQNYLMYEIVSLQDDSVYRVRKETVSRMIKISEVVGKDIFLRILFPVFKKLCNDSVWGVRRAAVEMIPEIAKLCPVDIKNGVAIEIFKKFAVDSSKWVKTAALSSFGPFVAAYEGQDNINPALLDYFLTMYEQNKSPAAENEAPYYLAYNFPAVLFTFGVKAWPKLKPLYETLSRDSRWKVRRTLAYSIHEMAKILGPELAEQDLLAILFKFMSDNNDVREGITVNLPKFIEILKPEQRENFIGQLSQSGSIDPQDWRKRVQQGQQIKQFSKIFSAQTVHKHYSPIFFQFCQDQVAEVRMAGAKCMRNLILKISEDEELFKDFLQKTMLFSSSNKYNLRQTFIYMCLSLMKVKGDQAENDKAKDLFIRYFMNELVRLSTDRVVNVRMCVSEILSKHHLKSPSNSLLLSLRPLYDIYQTLKQDKSRDVREPLMLLINDQFDAPEPMIKQIEEIKEDVNNSISNEVLQSEENTKNDEDVTKKQSPMKNLEEQEREAEEVTVSVSVSESEEASETSQE